MGVALALSLLLVYLLMLALYDSYRIPFIIMFTVPVAAVGAIGALAITHQTLNLFSLIGTMLLVGLVSKNGILLVDFANHEIGRGVDRVAAIRESAHARFRPIIMTTASMIAGMLPHRARARSGQRPASSARRRRDRRPVELAAAHAGRSPRRVRPLRAEVPARILEGTLAPERPRRCEYAP